MSVHYAIMDIKYVLKYKTHVCIYLTLPYDVIQAHFFKWRLTGLNLEFLFLPDCLPYQVLKVSLPYSLPIAGRRIVEFIAFTRVLVLCKRQTSC